MRKIVRYGRDAVLLGTFLWGIFESVWGLLQVLGCLASRHPLFALTGHFDNPGPFGGFLAMAMAVSGAYLVRNRRDRKGLYGTFLYAAAAVSFCCCLLVFPASMSRAGWLALGAAMLWILLSDKAVVSWCRSHRVPCLLAVIVITALCAGVFFLKKDSALGRLHLWRMECLAICREPLTGTGPNTFAGTYGKVQEAFFRAHIRDASPWTVRVAGCPEYAFNAYLGIGVEYGAPAMAVFAGALLWGLVRLSRRRSLFTAGLIAWAVFAFFSYPLSVPRINVLLFAFLIAGLLEGEWPGLLLLVLVAVLVALHRPSGFREKYARGYSLYQTGDYEESLRLLEAGAAESSDPMFHVIMGRCREASGDYEGAGKEYETAHYMVPCRLYPLVRLMHLKIKAGDPETAKRLGAEIVRMPVNGRLPSMKSLYDEARQVLDSLNTCSASMDDVSDDGAALESGGDLSGGN